MRITRKDLREMIWSQLASETGLEASGQIAEVKSEETMDFSGNEMNEFETVNDQTVLKEAKEKIEELRSISEEMRRMKQLVDFRSPLLSGEKL